MTDANDGLSIDQLKQNARENYFKLSYYFENEIPVHIKDLQGVFYNGRILHMSWNYKIIILKEFYRGEVSIFLESILPRSIAKYNPPGGRE